LRRSDQHCFKIRNGTLTRQCLFLHSQSSTRRTQPICIWTERGRRGSAIFPFAGRWNTGRPNPSGTNLLFRLVRRFAAAGIPLCDFSRKRHVLSADNVTVGSDRRVECLWISFDEGTRESTAGCFDDVSHRKSLEPVSVNDGTSARQQRNLSLSERQPYRVAAS